MIPHLNCHGLTALCRCIINMCSNSRVTFALSNTAEPGKLQGKGTGSHSGSCISHKTICLAWSTGVLLAVWYSEQKGLCYAAICLRTGKTLSFPRRNSSKLHQSPCTEFRSSPSFCSRTTDKLLHPQKIWVPRETYAKPSWKVLGRVLAPAKATRISPRLPAELWFPSFAPASPAAFVHTQGFYFPWSLYPPCRWRTELQKGCQAERQVFCRFKSPVPCNSQIPLPNIFY